MTSYSQIFHAASKRTVTEKTWMFILLITLLSLIHLSHFRWFTVCFRILIVGLNTKSSHFMFTPRFHQMFAHGNLVKSPWNPSTCVWTLKHDWGIHTVLEYDTIVFAGRFPLVVLIFSSRETCNHRNLSEQRPNVPSLTNFTSSKFI